MKTVKAEMTAMVDRHQMLMQKMVDAEPKLEKIHSVLLHLEALQAIKVVRFSMDIADGDYALSFSGTKAGFEDVWKVLRQEGYEPSWRPDDKPMAAFTTYFSQKIMKDEGYTTTDDTKLQIYLSFSSNECKMVEVRKETITLERPVYEVRCNEEA